MVTSIERGVTGGGGGLVDALWEWVTLQERGARIWDREDALWWYGERASLSTFAGAVWRAGGIALEEYQTEKHVSRRRGNRYGRGDLYLKVGREEYILEAKQVWCSVGSGARNSLKRVSAALRSATQDVKRAKSYGERRLAAVFVVPMIPKLRSGDIDARIAWWLEEVRGIDFTYLAWAFPPNARDLFDEGTLYPGVCVLLRRA